MSHDDSKFNITLVNTNPPEIFTTTFFKKQERIGQDLAIYEGEVPFMMIEEAELRLKNFYGLARIEAEVIIGGEGDEHFYFELKNTEPSKLILRVAYLGNEYSNPRERTLRVIFHVYEFMKKLYPKPQ